MAPPVKTVTNVLVGSAQAYIAPAGQTATGSAAYDTAWSSPWRHVGYTEAGLEFGVERKEKRHYVDELSMPVYITAEETTMTVSLGFAEATLQNLADSVGGGTVTGGTLVLSEDFTIMSLGFVGKGPLGVSRKIIIPRVVSIGKIKAEYKRSDNKQIYQAEFESICPIADVIITEA